jgi:hypothetical protein
MRHSNSMPNALPFLLILAGAIFRFFPHPVNVAPITAIALFGGVYLNKRWSIAIPLAAMVLSDLVMNIPAIRLALPWGAASAGWHRDAPIIWACFALVGLIGWWVRKRKTPLTVIGGALFGSLVFYLVTNWAAWAFWNLYPPTFQGLMSSYVQALPFFRNSLIGDIGYTIVLFGLYETVHNLARLKRARSTITS